MTFWQDFDWQFFKVHSITFSILVWCTILIFLLFRDQFRGVSGIGINLNDIHLKEKNYPILITLSLLPLCCLLLLPWADVCVQTLTPNRQKKVGEMHTSRPVNFWSFQSWYWNKGLSGFQFTYPLVVVYWAINSMNSMHA